MKLFKVYYRVEGHMDNAWIEAADQNSAEQQALIVYGKSVHKVVRA
jgi:hypothetical protein